MRSAILLGAVAIALPLLTGCGSDNHDPQPIAASTPIAQPTTTDPLAPGAVAPAGVSCGDIGGVFEPHGTDGRGTCVPADKSAHCHVASAAQDDHYVAEFVLTPPFPTGTVSPAIVTAMLDGASNADCWKIPAN